MAKLIRDPQLDELVRELNEGGSNRSSGGDPTLMTTGVVGEDEALEPLLVDMTQRGASDLLLVA